MIEPTHQVPLCCMITICCSPPDHQERAAKKARLAAEAAGTAGTAGGETGGGDSGSAGAALPQTMALDGVVEPAGEHTLTKAQAAPAAEQEAAATAAAPDSPEEEAPIVTYAEYYAARWGRSGLSPEQPLLVAAQVSRQQLARGLDLRRSRKRPYALPACEGEGGLGRELKCNAVLGACMMCTSSIRILLPCASQRLRSALLLPSPELRNPPPPSLLSPARLQTRCTWCPSCACCTPCLWHCGARWVGCTWHLFPWLDPMFLGCFGGVLASPPLQLCSCASPFILPLLPCRPCHPATHLLSPFAFTLCRHAARADVAAGGRTAGRPPAGQAAARWPARGAVSVWGDGM